METKTNTNTITITITEGYFDTTAIIEEGKVIEVLDFDTQQDLYNTLDKITEHEEDAFIRFALEQITMNDFLVDAVNKRLINYAQELIDTKIPVDDESIREYILKSIEDNTITWNDLEYDEIQLGDDIYRKTNSWEGGWAWMPYDPSDHEDDEYDDDDE